MTELISAVKDRNWDLVEDLLEEGKEVNERDSSGRTPLYFAAQKGLVDITRSLLNYGASTNLQTHWGSTPLHVAADKGFDEMLRVLATTRVTTTNLDLQNKNGDTALHLAAYRGKIGAVNVLVEEGASVLLANQDGRTPLADAEVNGHEEVVACLRRAAEAQTRQAERMMAAQPIAQQHWEVRDRLWQQGHGPPYIEPFQHPTSNQWTRPHMTPLPQPQMYRHLVSQPVVQQSHPVYHRPLAWQQAAVAQQMQTDHLQFVNEPRPFNCPPQHPPIRHQRLPTLPVISNDPRMYNQPHVVQGNPLVRPLATHVLQDSSCEQPTLRPPRQCTQLEGAQTASMAGSELSQYFEASTNSSPANSLIEKGDVEANTDGQGQQKERVYVDVGRQQSVHEHEQLEYKNMMLNEVIVAQTERMSDIDKLEDKNKALMDELMKAREENEALMTRCNDLVREAAALRETVARQETPTDASEPPDASERTETLQRCRPTSASCININGERLSAVASAVIHADGSLPPRLEERLIRLILTDISECTGINYVSNPDMSQCGMGYMPAVKGDKLCVEGLEWIYNVDYWLREDEPLNRPKDGTREGACSLVFRIEHKRYGPLILKVMINLINMCSAGHGSGQSMTTFLAGQFGAEHDVPLQLPKHPNIAEILHHFHGSTRPFNQFLRYMIPPQFDVHLEQASKTTFMVMREYVCTLRSFVAQKKEANPTPPYGLEQDYILCLLIQLGSAINHLLQYGVCHRDMKADNVFLDVGQWKVVLADFGHARSLYRGGELTTRKPIQFVESGQMMAGNSNAWAPEIVKSYKDGPPVDHDVFLSDIYAKTDVYGLGRMVYQMLCRREDEFPMGSVPYTIASLPPLPDVFSPSLRRMLEGMVAYDSSERLSARDAEVSSGLLLFGPQSWALTTEQAYGQWRSEQIFKCSLESSSNREDGKDRLMKELLSRLLYTTSAHDICRYANRLKQY